MAKQLLLGKKTWAIAKMKYFDNVQNSNTKLSLRFRNFQLDFFTKKKIKKKLLHLLNNI